MNTLLLKTEADKVKSVRTFKELDMYENLYPEYVASLRTQKVFIKLLTARDFIFTRFPELLHGKSIPSTMIIKATGKVQDRWIRKELYRFLNKIKKDSKTMYIAK